MPINKILHTLFYAGALLLSACSPFHASDEQSSSSLAGAISSPQFTTEFYKGGTLIYSDSPAIGRAEMISGETYTLVVKPLNSVVASYSIEILNRDTTATLLAKNVNANDPTEITFPVANDYQLHTVAMVDGTSSTSKVVNIAVTCSDPKFIVDSSKITATSNGSNRFTYSAAGVDPGGPDYECAWDFNGDGILDRNYGRCNDSVEAISNYVGSRQLSVSVRRVSCNNQVMASRTVTLLEPIAGAGINFIRGDVAQPDESDNARTNSTHSSTNNGGEILALCNYNDDTGVWSISGLNNYFNSSDGNSLGTSKQHGVNLSISGAPRNGITDGAIDTSNAAVSNARFITDGQSDGSPQFTFQTSSSCSLTNFQLTAQPLVGAPCAGGEVGQPGATVIGQGEFSCSNMSANERPAAPKLNIQNGKFFCMFHIGDSCIGGGGGGGIPPIKF